MRRSASLAGGAAIGAAAVWLAVWWHQRATHGPTEVNELERLFGLTWMDTAKFLVLSFVLIAVTLVALQRLDGRPHRFGWIPPTLSLSALALLALGTALEFWPFPWGSYDQGFDSTTARLGGGLQALASVALTIGLTTFAVAHARARTLPLAAAPLLPLAAVATFWQTPVAVVPGLAWLALGLALLGRRPGPGGHTQAP